jgi:hypothetical protein
MNLAFLPPLMAAADWLNIAIFLVIGFIWVMKKLFDLNKEAAVKRVAPPAGARPVQQRPQPGIEKPIAAGGQQADPLRSQVEEFLRRASRPQAGQAASSQRPPQRPQQPAGENEPVSEQQARAAQRRPAGSPSPAAPSAKQRPASGTKKRQSVAEHVAERVAAREKSVAEHTSRLGQRIVADDQQFDEQLNAKFDHTVGTLAGSINPVAQEASPPPADSPARRIAEMLANPDGVRQAVILNEVLRRPADRW